jgi:hypothetical protein
MEKSVKTENLDDRLVPLDGDVGDAGVEHQREEVGDQVGVPAEDAKGGGAVVHEGLEVLAQRIIFRYLIFVFFKYFILIYVLFLIKRLNILFQYTF